MMERHTGTDIRGWRRAYLTGFGCCALMLAGSAVERLGAPAGIVSFFAFLLLAGWSIGVAWTGGTLSAWRYASVAAGRTPGLGLWIAAEATVASCVLGLAFGQMPGMPMLTMSAVAGLAGCCLARLAFGPAVGRSATATVAAFLGHRTESNVACLLASVLAAASCFLLAVSLLDLAMNAATSLSGVSRSTIAGGFALLVCAMGAVGGVRSLARVQPLQVIALVLTAAAVALWLAIVGGEPLVAIPDFLPSTIGSDGAFDTMGRFVALAIAIAAMPHLLPRLASAAENGRHDGVLPAATATTLLMVPALGVAALCFPGVLGLENPAVGGLPSTMTALLAGACLLLLLGTAASLLLAAAATMARDLYPALVEHKAPDGRVLFVNRVVFVALVSAAMLATQQGGIDPETMAGAAITFVAAALFPALVLATFFPRAGSIGPIWAMLVGLVFGVSDMAALLGGHHVLPWPGDALPTAIFALPASLAAGALAMALAGRPRWRSSPDEEANLRD